MMLLLPMAAMAQKDDFGLDFTVEAQKKLSKVMNLSFEGELRTRDNTKHVDRWSAGLSLDYKAAKPRNVPSTGLRAIVSASQLPSTRSSLAISASLCVNAGNTPTALSIPSMSVGVISTRPMTASRRPTAARKLMCSVAVCRWSTTRKDSL